MTIINMHQRVWHRAESLVDRTIRLNFGKGALVVLSATVSYFLISVCYLQLVLYSTSLDAQNTQNAMRAEQERISSRDLDQEKGLAVLTQYMGELRAANILITLARHDVELAQQKSFLWTILSALLLFGLTNFLSLRKLNAVRSCVEESACPLRNAEKKQLAIDERLITEQHIIDQLKAMLKEHTQ